MRLLLIAMILLLAGCKLSVGSISRQARDVQMRGEAHQREVDQLREAERLRTTLPLPPALRAEVTRLTLMSLRDSRDAEIIPPRTSHEEGGVRVARYLVNARNGFGGFSGRQCWIATLIGGSVVSVEPPLGLIAHF